MSVGCKSAPWVQVGVRSNHPTGANPCLLCVSLSSLVAARIKQALDYTHGGPLKRGEQDNMERRGEEGMAGERRGEGRGEEGRGKGRRIKGTLTTSY